MRALGFETLLPDAVSAPILATFHAPEDPRFDLARFCRGMERGGFEISLRRAAVPGTLRIGCIGALEESDMAAVVGTAGDVLDDLGLAVPGFGRESQRLGAGFG